MNQQECNICQTDPNECFVIHEEQFTHEDVGKDHGSEDTKTPQGTDWIDRILNAVEWRWNDSDDSDELVREMGQEEAKSAILAHSQQEKQALLERLKADGPKIVYTLEQVEEGNKHLDSRMQQELLSKSAGIIERDKDWRQFIDTEIRKIKEGVS